MLNKLFKEILDGWQVATTERFTDHPIANKLRNDLKYKVTDLLSNHSVDFIIKASAGAGNWANVPWLSILDPEQTETTQKGIYPVYLFRSDGTGFYLSLELGVTELKNTYGTAKAKEKALKIAKKIHSDFHGITAWGNDEVDLRAGTPLGQSYEWGSVSAIFYDRDNVPNDKILEEDLYRIIDIYKKIPNDFLDEVTRGLEAVDKLDLVTSVKLPKPFILLAGISGTGKTRFVKKQAEAFGVGGDNYCLVPVRPDWHEPSDLLGYVSRLSGKPEYVTTKVLDFIVAAWRAIAPDADKDGFGELNFDAAPYWLCLDEMNLAPVEQYFADYLSVLESREFIDGRYTCEAILNKGLLKELDNDGGEIKSVLGLDDNDGLWLCFLNHGIPLPPNLIVAGTVNMDETTHGFSRKVIDRALTIDFGEFFPNDYAGFFDALAVPKTFTYSMLVQATKVDLNNTFDADGSQSIAFIEALNGILKKTPFELAYRALNELLLQVICFKPETEEQLQAVWDDFLMTKVLPRIDGDEDKLRCLSNEEDTYVLIALSVLLEKKLNKIWHGTRQDFYRVKPDDSVIDGIDCRSKIKLQWMQDRLNKNTFTSFWP